MSETDKAHKKLGNRGEDLAAQFLAGKGYTILERNYHAQHAEVDIICEAPPDKDGNLGHLVFVEVKTRTTRSSESPIEAISEQKLNHVRRAAEHYLYEKEIEDRYCRFDAIGVQINSGQPLIEHLEDVLDY